MQSRGGTIVGVLALGVIGFFTVAAIFQLNQGGKQGVATQASGVASSISNNAFKVA
jgi:hypothetical protein